MQRILRAFFVLGIAVVASPAAAQEPTDTATDQPSDKATEEPTGKPNSDEPTAKAANVELTTPKATAVEPVAPPPAAEEAPADPQGGWHTFVSGYFRAPFTMGFSPRPGPDNPNGPTRMQISYGPNRTVDSNYYSFGYTRLQEQDWAELFVHAKKKHAEAVVGWMGYWYQSSGFRIPDASWFPGMAYLTLDTDLGSSDTFKPNIALTVGSFWPAFGTFAKYDTYTLGRFRQLGEQVKFTLPWTPDLKVTLTQGFGTGRDGSFQYQITPPIYGATVGLDLMHYENIQLTYKKYVDIGLHYNSSWSRDPNLSQTLQPGKNYSDVADAYVTTVGTEIGLSAPRVGRLWISPSHISVRNGWALNNSGIEVMHSLGGAGLAGNYMLWTNAPNASTGTGTMTNLGFQYENTLSSILDKPAGSVMPEVTFSAFGLLASTNLELPATSTFTQNHFTQFKYGADLTVQPLTWLGVMGRFDQVNYDMDHAGYVFSAITARLIFSTHYLSTESIYLQYSRYRYGDKMVLAGTWPGPGNVPIVPGSDYIQGGTYAGTKPDMDVVKVQASVAF